MAGTRAASLMHIICCLLIDCAVGHRFRTYSLCFSAVNMVSSAPNVFRYEFFGIWRLVVDLEERDLLFSFEFLCRHQQNRNERCDYLKGGLFSKWQVWDGTVPQHAWRSKVQTRTSMHCMISTCRKDSLKRARTRRNQIREQSLDNLSAFNADRCRQT